METLDTFKSDVLLGRVGSSDLGFSFVEATVTYEEGMEMGAALELVAGKYVWVVAANVANTVGILVDASAQGYDDVTLEAGDQTLVVAVRGVTINKNKVTLADSVLEADITAASVAFEKAGANKVTDKVFG